MKRWVWIRAEIKNEIAALEKFGKENEMRPFHLWNGWYPNLATPHRGPMAHTQKNVYGFLHTRSSLRRLTSPARLCCAGGGLTAARVLTRA